MPPAHRFYQYCLFPAARTSIDLNRSVGNRQIRFRCCDIGIGAGFHGLSAVDSLSEKVEMLEHLSESCDSGDVRHIRSHYWRARLLSARGI